MTGKKANKNGIDGMYMKYFNGNSSNVQIGVWERLNIYELNEALNILGN